MHYKLLVTLNRAGLNTSHDARQRVRTTLLADPSFVGGDGGRFGSPVGDWGVIGGRWSGFLTSLRLDQKKLAAVEQEFEAKHGWWVGGTAQVTHEQRRDQYAAIFSAAFPDYQGELPAWREPYRELGASDDAQVVDALLYDAAIRKYEGLPQGWVERSYEGASWKELYFVDLDDEPVSPSFIDGKWLVVVDYHR